MATKIPIASPEELQSQQKSTILKVYNYYRIFLSFLFLFLFLDGKFVGGANPDLFQTTILIYIVANSLIGLATLFLSTDTLSKTGPSFIVLIGDIIALALLIASSGGVSSGLGNFLIFTVAFGGGLIHGRVSTVLPAIASVLTIYTETYLFWLGQNTIQSFFQAGLLGAVYFVANFLFQTLSQQIRTRETEVFTLEQINQFIVDRMNTGVVVVSADDQVRLINQAAVLHLTIPAQPEIASERLPYRLVDKLNLWRDDLSQHQQTFHTQASSPELVAQFSRLAGSGDETDTLIFIEDSTEVQRQAQQLKLASLGRLSASIAHEIRNPLGAISHAAQLLRESQSLDKGDERLCEIIQNHSVRMNDVIENVLQLSRRKNAEPQSIRFDEWVNLFLEEFTAALPEKPTIIREIDTRLQLVVDPSHLSQVLGNLCANGLRYSTKNIGEPKLVIHGSIDPDTQNPFVEVTDFGTGVDETLIPNLFEPFYTTESTGTGLGLYLSKELCEANNARLSYERAETGGSSFRISFFRQEESDISLQQSVA
ncbi:MAG: ATP-binding protein [Pseudomonadota bacterium]